jgi:hypothetical protein
MGFIKDQIIQEDEQGWSFTSQNVCTKCVEDYALGTAIRASESTTAECDFCGRRPAAPLDVLMEAFVNGLRSVYGDADDEGVLYDGREGGYQWGLTWDTWDLIGDFDDVLVGEGLLEAVRDAVHDRTWVEVNFAHPRQDEALMDSWERFCYAVQYETRYVFWLRNDESEEPGAWTGEIPASRILDEIGILIERLGLLHELPVGYRLWRGRAHSERGVTWTASDLGTVPSDKATKANRMSPAGIAMFYGSKTLETAAAEIAVRTADPWVTVGAFETSRPCTVVDFSDLPPVPSIFDPELGEHRRAIMFLRRFANELSKPARASHDQIDHVPTQVVTEYLLRIFGRHRPVVGLLFGSSLSHGVSGVLDVPHERCVAQEPNWKDDESLRLGLVEGSVRTIPTPRIA